MNFSFRRFCHLLKLQLVVNRKLYTLGTLAIAGILLAFLLFLSYMEGLSYNSQEFAFVIGLILGSTVFTSTIFKQFARKESRTAAVMMPVSVLERLAVAVVLVIIVFPLLYTLISLPCFRIANWVDAEWNGHVNPLFTPGHFNDLIGFIVNFFIQSCMLVGAIWFRKHAFVKTVALLAALIFGFMVLNNGLTKMAFKNVTPERWAENRIYFTYYSSSPYYRVNLSASTIMQDGVTYFEGSPNYYVSLSKPFQLSVWGLLALTPFFLWLVTGLKIREQQV